MHVHSPLSVINLDPEILFLIEIVFSHLHHPEIKVCAVFGCTGATRGKLGVYSRHLLASEVGKGGEELELPLRREDENAISSCNRYFVVY